MGRTTGELTSSSNQRRILIAKFVVKLTSRTDVYTTANIVISQVIRLTTAGRSILRKHLRGKIRVSQRGRILQLHRKRRGGGRRGAGDLHHLVTTEVVNMNRVMNQTHLMKEDAQEDDPTE